MIGSQQLKLSSPAVADMRILKISALALPLLILLGVSFIPSAHRAQKGEKPDEPTPVIEGVLTERELRHSRLFEGRGTGKKLLDFTGEAHLVIGPGLEAGITSNVRPTLSQYLGKRICASDAVVIGKVLRKQSQLTTDGEFIFTDFSVKVESVLKNDRQKAIGLHEEIVVTGPGGKVSLRGRVLTVEDRNQARLMIGDRYLLFMVAVPETGAYTLHIDSGRIEESDDSLDVLSSRGRALRGANITQILDIIAQELKTPCKN